MEAPKKPIRPGFKPQKRPVARHIVVKRVEEIDESRPVFVVAWECQSPSVKDAKYLIYTN